ncbi:MAG: hypothetical protein WCA10_02075 [Terracidiphilus sp.]
MKLVLFGILATAGIWVLTVALNPWALHIGGRSTPLLYWHGTGTVVSKDGKTYPLYMSFWPGRPGRHGGGRREGKIWSADLKGTGWLCFAPGSVERMDVSGTMYGGYTSSDDSLFSFRLLEWQKPFQINYHNRGFFDLAGNWHGPLLVMDRPNEQGIKLNTGPFIDHATVTLHWASHNEFESTCRNAGSSVH